VISGHLAGFGGMRQFPQLQQGQSLMYR